MSLEAALAEQTAALKELTAITTKLYELRADAIETVKAAAAPKGGKAADTKPKTDAKPTEAPASAVTDAAEDLTPIQAAVAAYVGAEDISEEERKARQGEVKKVLAHPKINAKKVGDVPENMHKAFLKAIADLTARGNVLTPPAAEEDDDDLGI